MRVSPLGFLRRAAFYCVLASSLCAQNYNSYMNGVERSREAARYESALLQGTYNNPMLSRSQVQTPDWGAMYRRREQAEQEAREQARWEQERAAYFRREAAAAEERRIAEWKAEEARRAIVKREEERRRAGDVARAWGEHGVYGIDRFIEADRLLRGGELKRIPSRLLYAAAASRYFVTPNDYDRELAVAAVARALDEGQLLPALLLAEPALRTPNFTGLIARLGVEYDRDLAFDYTLYYSPTPEEERRIRHYGFGRPALHEEYEAQPKRIEQLRREAVSKTWEDAVFKVLDSSALLPWGTRLPRVDHEARQALRTLRELRPDLGYFATALYEHRMRYDQGRPSLWADFMFARAAELSGSAFVQAFVTRRLKVVQAEDARLLKEWRAWRLRTPRSVIDSGRDPAALFRLAGRLVLGHGLPSLAEDLVLPGRPEVVLSLRRRLAHEILSELTQRRVGEALTLQYLAAVQEPEVRSPSLLAYMNAFHWLMDWDDAPVALRPVVLQAASFLESAPVSQYTWFYLGSQRAKSTGYSLSDDGLGPYSMLAFASSHAYTVYSQGYLESLPLQSTLFPAVARLRGRLPSEGGALQRLLKEVSDNGFQARLSYWVLRDCALSVKDEPRVGYIDSLLERLPPEQPETPSHAGALSLWLSWEAFAKASASLQGASLLNQPLYLEAAESSAQLLDVVALRNMLCKPLMPAARVLPLSQEGLRRLHEASLPVRSAVAVQALHTLDATLATQARLSMAEVLLWLGEGAKAGDEPCRLRRAQLALKGAPYSGDLGLSSEQALAELERLVAAGLPGALEYRYERELKANKDPVPLNFGDSLAAALRRRSPLAAQAWLDSLSGDMPFTPERAALEARALVIAAADLRGLSSGAWWKALCALSSRMGDNRKLLVGAPGGFSEDIARSLSELIRQREASRLFCDTERKEPDDQGIFSHISSISASLLPGEQSLGLRHQLMGAGAMRGMLAQRSGLPLDQAIYELRTQPAGLRRSFAAMDAVRWYAIDASSMIPKAGFLILEALPDQARMHPLWEEAAQLEFTRRLLADGTFPGTFDGETQLRCQKRLLARVTEHLGEGDEFAQAYLLEALETYSTRVRSVPALATQGDWGSLLSQLEILSAKVERVRGTCALIQANMGGKPAIVKSAIQLLQEGDWDALRRLDSFALGPREQLEILRCVPALEQARVLGSVEAIMSWALATDASGEGALSAEQAAQCALILREIAQRWLSFDAGEAQSWQSECFSLLAQAELLEPKPEATLPILQALAKQAKGVLGSSRAMDQFRLLSEAAYTRRELPLLKMLALFDEASLLERLDELEGFPRRKAAEASQARFEARLDRLIAFLEAGREGALCARVTARLLNDGVMLNDYLVMRMAKALCPKFPSKLLPAESSLRSLQARLLEHGSSGWDAEETVGGLARDLEPLARALWQERASWEDAEPVRLYLLVRHYADMDFAWAKEARARMLSKPSPLVHLMRVREGRPQDPACAPIDEALLASPAYQAARKRIETDPYQDEPYTEFDALK